jgi:3-hydroxyacyl-[acyl-carrier-protein] dehydratase
MVCRRLPGSGLLPVIDPAVRLPHRNPFLFIDRVTRLEPGISAEALALITSIPATSPVLLVEAMAQLAGIVAIEKEGEIGSLAAIDLAEFLRPVSPGDSLRIAVRIIKRFGRLVLCQGEITVEGQTVVTATLTLGVGAP